MKGRQHTIDGRPALVFEPISRIRSNACGVRSPSRGSSPTSLSADHAAGWEVHLDRLDAHLAGGHLSFAEAAKRVPELHERYAEAFGLDPEPGRRRIAEHLDLG